MDFLNEWKNVSDDVIEIADYVIDKILEDCNNVPVKYSDINKKPIITNSNTLKIYINQNNVNQIINVKYVLYDVDDDYTYDVIMDAFRPNLNCEWDEETKTLTIVSVLVNKQPNSRFQQSVVHEIEHMYQYFMGMGKRVDLYDKCVDMYMNGNRISQPIGLCMYYTFKHEQDAYVQQFYRHLYKYNTKKDFEEILNEYEPFKIISATYDKVDELYDNKVANKYINDLGYSRRDYYKRLYFGYNRLIKKMENAYRRWLFENRDKFLTRGQKLQELITNVKGYFKLEENYNNNDNNSFILEPFYQCYYR